MVVVGLSRFVKYAQMYTCSRTKDNKTPHKPHKVANSFNANVLTLYIGPSGWSEKHIENLSH